MNQIETLCRKCGAVKGKGLDFICDECIKKSKEFYRNTLVILWFIFPMFITWTFISWGVQENIALIIGGVVLILGAFYLGGLTKHL